jgi:DNA-nicking Smr family endonuclease
MPRRGARAGDDAPKGKSGSQPLNAPFRGLRSRIQSVEPAPKPAPPASAKPSVPPPPPVDDEQLFRHAMAGVAKLPEKSRDRVAPPAVEPRPPTSEDSEALAQLCDLVRGDTNFDISDTQEYVEGHVVGLDPRLVRRLRRGDFAWQAHVDLHGQTAPQARETIERFVLGAVRDGQRCVLVVHGRGLNSKDHVPVLKERTKSWLARGRLGRHVLAFTSARPHDGGTGALYELLRRDRTARPIRVTEGAKR